MIKKEAQSNKPKKENLKQRAYLNSITSVLDYTAKIVTTFFVTPFLVSGLGSMLFGVWKVLEQFAGYANMADIKVTEVLKWAVARDRDKKSKEELQQYVTATFLLILFIVPIILVIGTIIIWYSPTITGVDRKFYDVVRIATALLILSLVIKKVFYIFESILRGMNIGFKRMGFRAIVFLVGGALQILVVLKGYGLIALACIQVLVTFVIGITVYLIVKRHVPWFGWGVINIKKSLSFLKISGWFMGWTGTKILLLQSDKILLGFLAGPIIVTQYVITEYGIKAVKGIIGNVVHGVTPGMGKLYGDGEMSKMSKARNHIMILTWLLAVTIGALIILFNESFVKLWVQSDNYAGHIGNILILIVVVQYLFIQNDSALINLTLDIKQKVYLGLISAVVSIIIAYFLIEEYAIIGLCIGLIIGRSILSIGYPYIINKKINSEFSILPIRSILTTIVLWSLMYYMNSYVLVNNWLELFLFAILASFLIFITSLYLGTKQIHRNEIFQLFKKVNLFKTEK